MKAVTLLAAFGFAAARPNLLTDVGHAHPGNDVGQHDSQPVFDPIRLQYEPYTTTEKPYTPPPNIRSVHPVDAGYPPPTDYGIYTTTTTPPPPQPCIGFLLPVYGAYVPPINVGYLPPTTYRPYITQTSTPPPPKVGYLPPEDGGYVPPGNVGYLPPTTYRPYITQTPTPPPPNVGYLPPVDGGYVPSGNVRHLPPTNYGTYTTNEEPVHYKYGYSVQDPYSGVNFGHNEGRDFDEAKGEYRVLLPDGRNMIVTYTANKSGYRPEIRFEEAKGGNAKGQNGY